MRWMRWLRFGKPRWQDVDLLTLVPRRSVDHARDESRNTAVLLVPRFQDRILGRWLQPRLRPEKRYLKVPLEHRGTFLWEHCDGTLTIAQLATRFREEFPDDDKQVETRICQFLYQMERNGFMEFTNPAAS